MSDYINIKKIKRGDVILINGKAFIVNEIYFKKDNSGFVEKDEHGKKLVRVIDNKNCIHDITMSEIKPIKIYSITCEDGGCFSNTLCDFLIDTGIIDTNKYQPSFHEFQHYCRKNNIKTEEFIDTIMHDYQ